MALFSVRDVYRLDDPDTTWIVPGHVEKLYKSKGRSSTSYDVDYTYGVGPMTVHARTVEISAANWNRLSPGDGTLEIKYLMADPTVSRPVLPGQSGFAELQGWIFVGSSSFVVLLRYWVALFRQDSASKRKTKRAGRDWPGD